jgi:uncharacterized protein (TIGR02145 family)
MNKLYLLALMLWCNFSCNPYKKEFGLPNPDQINAQLNDPSTYPVFETNTQIWMAQNWGGNQFRNGDTLFFAATLEDWIYASDHYIPAWCYQHFWEPSSEELFSNRFYNWHAVNDPRGLAPEGWRIPNVEDWEALLIHYIDDEEKIKELKSVSGWDGYENGNNTSGFNAIPYGLCGDMDGFMNEQIGAYWWTRDRYNTEEAWQINISSDNSIRKSEMDLGAGMSIRLIKN